MADGAAAPILSGMPQYLLRHRHDARECPIAFAAWKGHESPLRHRLTLASCVSGGHAIWWTVEAASVEAALGLLPNYLANRTEAVAVGLVQIP
jgi:hypothetical protein